MKLTHDLRQTLPASDFGLPAERKYPMPDKRHAALALAMAKLHHVSATELAAVRRKAKALYPDMNISGLHKSRP